MKNELALLDAITLHLEGKYLKDDQKDEFWGLVRWIFEEKPGLNDLPEQEIGWRLHVRKYEKQAILKELAFFEVGRMYGERKEKATLKDFAFFAEHMEHGFYLGYDVSRDELADIVDGIDGQEDTFLSHCRSMNDRREDFVAYCQTELNEATSDDELIGKMNLYNTGDYIELPLGVYDLASFLIRDGHYDLYAKLLVKLSFFPLQGALLCWLHCAGEAFKIWEELEKLQPARVKVIEFLLRDRTLKLLGDEPEMLERNAQNEYISEADRQVGKELLENWYQQSEGMAYYLVDLSIVRFGESDTSEWYARQQARLSGREEKFVKHELQSLTNIAKCLEPRLNLTKDLLKGKDLNTLLYYAKVASGADRLDKAFYADLVATICQHVYSDRYVRALKLDKESFETMRDVYRCILKGGIDGIQVMGEYRQTSVGHPGDYSEGFRQAMGDSVWLPILMLITEEVEDLGYFRRVMEILTGLASFDKSVFNDKYFATFYLAELVVLQVLIDEKDAFEHYLITKVCNLNYVLRILSANDGRMSDENKEALRQRVDREWRYEKMLASQYREQTEQLDEYLKKVYN